MPFVSASAPATDDAQPRAFESLLNQLDAPDGDARRSAARALSQYPQAAAALAARLDIEPESRVRDALFGGLVEIGGAPSAAMVAAFIRSADAGLRGGAIESLKRLGPEAVSAVDTLLDDPDPDVRLLAIEVARDWSSVLAAPRLRRIIDHDHHVNVLGAAVDVATEVGDRSLVDPLARLRERFAHEPFLVFAIEVALSRIQVPDEPGG
jgi:HEAT repeat protein